jgi:hypothetical protein
MNALKHGMSARIPVLPGEDPEAFRCQVNGFIDALTPRDAVQIFLAEQAAFAAWKIRRAERAEAARLAAILRAAPTAQDPIRQEEVAAMGRWLIASDFRKRTDAADAMRPFLDTQRQSDYRGSYGDPLHIVFRLEATADGCRWLLERWAELRAPLESGQDWEVGEMVRAIQLLGQRRLDLDVGDWEALVDGTYARAKPALMPERERQLLRLLDEGIPTDKAGRATALRRVVERATARLEVLKAAHERREAADLAELADRLAFDTTPEGEQMRRHQVASDRALHRAINSLLKLRRDQGLADETDPGGAPDPEPEPGLSGSDEPPSDERVSPEVEPEALAAPAAEPPSGDEDGAPARPIMEWEGRAPAQNEPSAPAGADGPLQNEPSPPAAAERILPYEPGRDTGPAERGGADPAGLTGPEGQGAAPLDLDARRRGRITLPASTSKRYPGGTYRGARPPEHAAGFFCPMSEVPGHLSRAERLASRDLEPEGGGGSPGRETRPNSQDDERTCLRIIPSASSPGGKPSGSGTRRFAPSMATPIGPSCTSSICSLIRAGPGCTSAIPRATPRPISSVGTSG